MILAKDVMKTNKCIISLIGNHARELQKDILKRKNDDIKNIGRTFWIARIDKSIVPVIQDELVYENDAFIVFIEPSNTKATRDTQIVEYATQYSENKISNWKPLDKELSPVTGNIRHIQTAFVICEIEQTINQALDLRYYIDIRTNMGIKFNQSCTTVFAKRSEFNIAESMKTPLRRIVAVGRLIKPYCCFVK